eukprot:9217997-Pyramimonas_sp.AAC.2
MDSNDDDLRWQGVGLKNTMVPKLPGVEWEPLRVLRAAISFPSLPLNTSLSSALLLWHPFYSSGATLQTVQWSNSQ